MSNALARVVVEDLVEPVVPRLSPPYASALHPDAVEVERQSIAWLRSFGVGGTRREAAILTGGRCAGRAARGYAQAPAGRLRVVTDFVTWAFLFDEHCETGRDRAAIDRLCAAVIGVCWGAEAAHPAPLVHALADLRRRVFDVLGAVAATGPVERDLHQPRARRRGRHRPGYRE
jgi:hypothetical protein